MNDFQFSIMTGGAYHWETNEFIYPGASLFNLFQLIYEFGKHVQVVMDTEQITEDEAIKNVMHKQQ